MAVDLALSPKRNRTRSPSYPYVDLPAALEKAATLWRAEGRHPVAVNVAMQHWGYKEDSSTGYSCIAALKKFGLVDHEGMGETRQVRLSALVLTILLDNDPGSPDRRDALRKAALSPRIHAELWERYGAELPSEQSLRRFLVVERSFNEASVDELLDEYKATMAFAGLHVGPGRGASPAAVSASVASSGSTPLPPIVPVPPVAAVTTDPRGGPAVASVEPRGPHDSADRQGAPLPAPRLPARAVGATALAWNSPPPAGAVSAVSPIPAITPVSARATNANGNGHGAPPRQPSLFGDGAGEADDFDAAPVAEETLAPPRLHRADQQSEARPWSMARRELPVPLDNDLVARVPYPMTEEDFALLMDTLQLWKKRLVQPQR